MFWYAYKTSLTAFPDVGIEEAKHRSFYNIFEIIVRFPVALLGNAVDGVGA